MNDPDSTAIADRMRQEEERLRRRVAIFTLIPTTVAILLIVVTGLQISHLENVRIELASDTTSLKQYVDSLTAEAGEIQEAVQVYRGQADSLKLLIAALRPRITTTAFDGAEYAASAQLEEVRRTPRIYIHIRREDQRPAAADAQRVLEGADWEVPGIERLSTGPSVSELRYFRAEDGAMAQAIRDTLAAGGVVVELRDLSMRYARSSSIEPMQFEIWFGEDFGGSRG